MPQIRILIADDNESVRKRLLSMLFRESDLEPVAAAENGKQAVDLAREHLPDVVLMDVEMPVMNGVEATRRILASRPSTKVIAFSGYLDSDYVREMLRAGASGYVQGPAQPANGEAAARFPVAAAAASPASKPV